MPGLVDVVLCAGLVAGLTSLAIESPVGRWLREALAGAPTEDAFEVWRNNGADARTIPEARIKWLASGMECQRCVSAHVAALVVPCWLGWGSPLSSLLLYWGGTWVLARIAIGLARDIEERI